MEPIRVTHVVFDFDGGGLETLIAEMASIFRGTPVQVSLVSLSGRAGRLGEATRDRFDQFHVVKPARGISMIYPRSAAKSIRLTRADVVHLHNGAWFKGAIAARLAGVRRVVYTEHGREHFDPWRNRFLDRQAARATNVIAAVSERLEVYLRDRVGLDPRKLLTIHNGVNTTAFTPAPPDPLLRQALGIPESALVIGSVGRLEAVKAYHRLLDVAARMRGSLADPFYVVIAGEGSQRRELEARARELGVADILRLPGWMSNTADFYRLLDVFVLCSVSEGQSVSLMEAMASGVAPVVTDVGGNAQLVGERLTAQVVTDADVVGGLTHAILATVAKPDRLRAIGENARQRAVGAYSLTRMAHEYERVYRDGPGVP
jgi:L-malate glycosyltransferase